MKPFALAALLLVTTPAAHLGAAEIPFKNPGFDVSKLTRENFYDVIVPLAKKNGPIVMYNFAGTFGSAWTEGLIKPFTEKYGIPVELSDVKGGQANQQLIAVHQSKQDSPVDLYFTGGGDYVLLSSNGIIPTVNLAKLLPNMASYDPKRAETVFGAKHGGTFNLAHLNQTAIGYNSALVKAEDVPRDFDALLTWAEKNPKKFAVTLPAKGGSGGGFIYSVALHYLKGECLTALTNQAQSPDKMLDWVLKTDCLKPVWDYYTRLAKAAELTNGNADTLNLINNKSAWMGAVWEDQVTGFVNNKQLPPTFRMTLLEKGQVGSGDALIIPTNAKNVAGALLLMDMAHSAEFQAWKLANRASRSPRLDISEAVIPEASRPYFLSSAVYPRLSVEANWSMSVALGTGLDEKVLNK